MGSNSREEGNTLIKLQHRADMRGVKRVRQVLLGYKEKDDKRRSTVAAIPTAIDFVGTN